MSELLLNLPWPVADKPNHREGEVEKEVLFVNTHLLGTGGSHVILVSVCPAHYHSSCKYLSAQSISNSTTLPWL